jgi:hypothetical protein
MRHMDVGALPAGSRRGIRRSVDIGCEVISTRWDAPAHFRASDLSLSGLWLPTPDPVRAGEEVVVCFEPGDEWHNGELWLFAEVVRVVSTRRASGGGGMGLAFLDLGARDEALLGRWLDRRKMPVPRRRRPVPLAPLPAAPQAFRPVGVWR